MGKILLQSDSLKTERVPKENCDKAIGDFCDMHDCATMAEDKFYADESLYGDNDAPIYRFFTDWPEFVTKKYSEGVSFNSYKRLQNIFVQNPNISSVKSLEQFNQLDNPKARGGLRIPGGGAGMLVDVDTWRKWREWWFCAHQEQVIWKDWDKDFFVNKNRNIEILRDEVRSYIADELDISKAECTDEEIEKYISSLEICHESSSLERPLKGNALVIFFHGRVMSGHARGGDRQGYLTEIGGKICRANYYIEIPDLTEMEKESAPGGRNNTQRSIWGIKNNLGQWKFISFDFEKGMFEFHDDTGTHVGEFMFDGSRNSDAKNDHLLRCVMAWKAKNYKCR